MRTRPLLIVEWDDAYGTNKWHPEDELDDAHPMRCTTVGWRMPAPPGCFSIASTRDGHGKCADRMTIPRGNVKSIRKLAIVSKQEARHTREGNEE